MVKPVLCPICGTKNIYLCDVDVENWKPGTEMGVVLGEEYTGSYSWDFVAVAYECENRHGFYIDQPESTPANDSADGAH